MPRHYSMHEQNLQVEFGRVNRHFNVPNPLREGGNSQYLKDLTPELAEANRFYKFVAKIHIDYRAFRRGDGVAMPIHNMLTAERILQLREIGFEFGRKAEKSVPEMDWSARVQQLEAFRSEMGHLRVDPNYAMYSNLGGWAVEVSERHRAWREGGAMSESGRGGEVRTAGCDELRIQCFPDQEGGEVVGGFLWPALAVSAGDGDNAGATSLQGRLSVSPSNDDKR